MVVKTIDGYLCGGNQTPLYQIRERNVWSQPTGTHTVDVPGGWGNCTRCPSRERKHRAAFCRSRTRAQRAPQPVAPAFTNHNAATRVQPHGRAVGKHLATNLHDMARPCAPDQPTWFGLLSGCSWRRPHTTKTNIYIHARASAARFSDNVTTQGERFRKAPRGASGSAASLKAADVDGGRAMDAPKRPRRRPGAGTPGRGAGCCWRPKIEGRRMHSSGRDGRGRPACSNLE